MTIYIGIDWSEDKHDVVFLNKAGAIIGQLTMAHTLEGLGNLEKTRQYLGVSREECWVALETAHNLVIDFLWEQGYQQVYVIAPSVIKSCRGRYGQSGARTDRHEGRLIADVLRTDRARLQPWQPDSALTPQMPAQVSLLLHLNFQLRPLFGLINDNFAFIFNIFPHICHSRPVMQPGKLRRESISLLN